MKRFILFSVIAVVLIPLTLSAGSSVFGLGPRLIGDYRYPISTAAMGRGGVSIGLVDSIGINYQNFALWHSLSRSTIGLDLSYQNISSEVASESIASSTANFNGGFLVLPLESRKFAIGFGLIPYSQNDIQLQITQTGSGATPNQTVSIEGNISQAHFGAAYKFTNTLSIALSLNYTFGLISDITTLEYAESGFGDLSVENRYQIYGSGFGAHAYYQVSDQIGTGLTATLPTTLTLFTEQQSISQEKTIDENRELTLPLQLGFGITYIPTDRWILGLDYHTQSWKDGYKVENERVANTANSFRFALGAERVPSSRRFSSYGDNITWRIGVFMGQLNTLSNNKTVNEFGATFGIGLPIAKNRNRFDIAFEFGKRGSIDSNQRSETYFRVNFALSTNELWFVREER
jgi:opacity protein-like surface antigen